MRRFLASFMAIGLVGALSVMGCGGESGGTGSTESGSSSSSGGQGLALAMFPGGIAKVLCDIVSTCCDLPELAEVFGVAPKDQAACEAGFVAYYEKEIIPSVQASIDAGRVTYDGVKAASCLANMKGDCSLITVNPFDSIPDCQAMIVGKVADGGDCSNVEDCAVAGSTCGGLKDASPGKCAPPGAVGAPCVDDLQCKDSFCDVAGGVCAAKKADAEACSAAGECTSGRCEPKAGACASTAMYCDGK